MKRIFDSVWSWEPTQKIYWYIRTRFYIGFLVWVGVFLLYRLISNFFSPVDWANIKDLVDYRLIAALFGSYVLWAAAIPFTVHIFIKEQSDKKKVFERRTLPEMLDDISTAATHFAFAKIALVMSSLASASFVDFKGGVASICVFFMLAAACFDREKNQPNSKVPIASYLGLRITSPVEGDLVETNLPIVSGECYREPPTGYEYHLVRRWKSKPNSYYPVRKIESREIVRSDRGIHWTCENVFVGGEPGNGRYLEIWALGPEGIALFSAWYDGNQAFQKLRSFFKDTSNSVLFSSLESIPSDAVRGGIVRLCIK